MTEQTTSGSNWLLWIIFGLMWLVSLACIGIGGTFCGYAIRTWAVSDYVFSGWGMIDWAVGLLGAALAGIGVLILGFFFRFVSWGKAPVASLVLSIVSTACILAIYAIFSQTQSGINSFDIMILQTGCILALFILVLPPFLHWYLAQRPASSTIQASGPSGTTTMAGKEGADARR